jgi:N-acetyl-alpha-D-glucosaminyl L-malate synthase BshA
VATEIAEALVRHGHEVHLVACDRPFRLHDGTGVLFESIEVPNYPIFRCPPHDLSLANKLAEVTKKHDIDIIHAHYAVPHSVTALLARDMVQPHHVKIVTTLHGTDITLVGSHKNFFDLVRYAMIRSDATTAVSKWLVDETMRRFDLPTPPELIPNFVDPAHFHPESRVGLPEPGEPFHLVHASNLRPVKRIADILHVFNLVARKIPARLTILGDGPERGLAEELAGELRIGDRVTFSGISEDMPTVLRQAHLYMLLSHYESFGLSALEAMACGTPVVGTLSGGLPEVVTDGETGLLTPVGSPQETARRIIHLLTNADLWNTMSQNASEVARTRFTVERVIPQYESLYQRVSQSKN